jgi:hypothetical protein
MIGGAGPDRIQTKIYKMFIKLLKKLYTPGLLTMVCVLAYGLQLPWLGYYLDDWIILAAYKAGGAQGLLEYAFLGNRPLVFWLWWAGFKLLGYAPLGWQLWTLLWRCLTVVTAWLALRELWPGQARRALWAALLFAVYPLFFQQPTALTYSFHWVCFCLFNLSLYWMIRAARSDTRAGHYAAWTAPAVLVGAVEMFSQEFFIGLELLRPLVLFLVLDSEHLSLGKRLQRTALHWGPYLTLFSGYLAWRLAFMPTPGTDRNAPDVLQSLITSPLSTLPSLISMVLQDLTDSLVGVWYHTIQASTFETSPLSNWAAWGLAVATGLVVAVGLRFLHITGAPGEDTRWRRSAFLVGFSALVLGFAPGWAIGRHFSDTSGMYNDRFGLAAMLGASILVTVLIDVLIRPGRWQTLLLCLLVGLAVGQHFRSTTLYRWSWEEQTRLFWQIKWRVPGLQTPTAIFGNGALVRYIGSWANTSALNLMYSADLPTRPADYWYFDLYRYNLQAAVENDTALIDESNLLHFNAAANDSLVLVDSAVPDQCTWIVSEEDRHNPYLEDVVRAALPLSNLARIQPDASQGLREDIFGAEPPPSWCTYFEKARLAEQQGKWEEMVTLWNEAVSAGFHPRSEVEYVPFIRAAAHTNRWDLALDLSDKAYYPTFVMHDYLCTTWRHVKDEVPASPERQQALEQAVNQLDCQTIFTP